jgi:trans-aconitate methyltransferase
VTSDIGDMKRYKKSVWTHPLSMKYHLEQWEKPKQSTFAFEEFFRHEFTKSQTILDIGCGTGSSTYHLARKFPETNFIGIDNSLSLVNKAKQLSKKNSLKNLSFEYGDVFSINKKFAGSDGVISLQTLSWLSEINKPMKQIFKIQPNWIGVSSLFYEGDISCKILVTEHRYKRNFNYNVYSIEQLSKVASKFGYQLLKFSPFEIDIDISKPQDIDKMGTFTEKIVSNLQVKRIQISGPLLLNWYFVLLVKKSYRSSLIF